MKTIADCFGQLTAKDKIILCRVISLHCDHYEDVSPATLAFVPADEALSALRIGYVHVNPLEDTGIKGLRLLKALLHRLEGLLGVVPPEQVNVIRYLNDGKVAKRFGAHPERGKLLKGHIKKTTAGLKWSLPAKDYMVNDDHHATHMVVLKCIAKGRWQVTCQKQHLNEVDRYLIDFCQ